jgi:hypothetical protein
LTFDIVPPFQNETPSTFILSQEVVHAIIFTAVVAFVVPTNLSVWSKLLTSQLKLVTNEVQALVCLQLFRIIQSHWFAVRASPVERAYCMTPKSQLLNTRSSVVARETQCQFEAAPYLQKLLFEIVPPRGQAVTVSVVAVPRYAPVANISISIGEATFDTETMS